MVQPTFFDQEGIAELVQLPGASGGHLLDWLNHGHYAAKEYSADKPYTLISEYISADIASLLGLPIPARQIIPFRGKKMLGFEWRGDAKSFEPGMEIKLTNANAIPGMLAFDVLLGNRDRHRGNVLFQRPSPNLDRYTFYLIDHSHALIGDMPDMETFTQFLEQHNDPTPFLQAAPEQLRALVSDWADFDPWLAKIESLTGTNLHNILVGIPSEWIPHQGDCSLIIDFLLARKNRVRHLLVDGRLYFPKLR
ncbi:hypothetical protein ES703_86640 [subsurface metagenome]